MVERILAELPGARDLDDVLPAELLELRDFVVELALERRLDREVVSLMGGAVSGINEFENGSVGRNTQKRLDYAHGAIDLLYFPYRRSLVDDGGDNTPPGEVSEAVLPKGEIFRAPGSDPDGDGDGGGDDADDKPTLEEFMARQREEASMSDEQKRYEERKKSGNISPEDFLSGNF